MAKAASNMIESAKKDPLNAALVVGTGGLSAVVDAGLKSTGNKTIAQSITGGDKGITESLTSGLSDPFGSKAAAQEQEDRLNDALKAVQDADPLKSSSVTNQSSTTDQSSTSKTSFDKAGKVEQAVTKGQLDALKQQQKQVADQQKDILAREGTQGAARDALGNVLSGDAFELNQSEETRINRMRDAGIAASSGAVNEMLNTRLADLQADAAKRGVRGQAFSQLQTGALGTAARELNMATLDANKVAAGQALEMPGQRAGIQANTAGQFAGFADQLQQQAIQNLSTLQDPVLKQQLLDERLKAATTSTTGKTSTTGTSTTNSEQELDPTGLLQIKAQSPGPKASTIAGNLGVLGTGAQVAGAVAPFVKES